MKDTSYKIKWIYVHLWLSHYTASIIPPIAAFLSFENNLNYILHSVQFIHSVVSNSLWPHGLQHARLPIHHQLLEFMQTHAHWVSDAIQPSHPLFSPSSPAFNLSQQQGLYKWVSFQWVFSNESVLCIRWPKYWSFSFSISLPVNIQDWFPLGWTSWISLLSKRFSRVFFNTPVQMHQLFSAHLSL